MHSEQRNTVVTANNALQEVSATENAHKSSLLVCHIIYKLDFGGLENGLVNLINLLPDSHYRHTIICLTHATEFRQRIQRKDVEIYELHKKEGKDFTIYAKLWRVLRRLGPDIVHTRNLPTIDMLAVAWFAGVKKLVHSEHGLDFIELGGDHKKYNRLRRVSRLVVDRYISLSRDLLQWLNQGIGIPLDKIALIYNGVDTVKFAPGTVSDKILPEGFAPEHAFVIGTVGRLEMVKDQVTLAQAFVHLLMLRPDLKANTRLAIIGDGNLRPEIESLLSQHQLQDVVWMPGYLENTADAYRAFDLFVLPSRREGISNTVLEAMASGLAVVATRTGGNPEIIDHGITGHLVPVTQPAAMAEAILQYINDPTLLDRHGQAARKHVESNFSMSAMIAAYRNVYEAL